MYNYYDISIILPVYKVESYFSACMDSILSQNFEGSLQIILVEDKSPDNSLDLCRKYALEYDNVELIVHEENGGSAVARNSGLGKVQGKYFVFVDPDDILPNTAVKTLYDAIENTGADIVKGSNSSFSKNKVKGKSSYSVNSVERFFSEDCLTTLFKHEKLRGHPWGKIFRTENFKDIRFTPGYRMAQDLLYCSEVFSKATSLVIIPDIVYHYRIHSGGATGRKYETGAYKSWLKCISQIGGFANNEAQQLAHIELKIRTLNQIAREIRSLRGESLVSVLDVVNQTRNDWLPSFWSLVFMYKIPSTSVLRYLKYKMALRKAKNYI